MGMERFEGMTFDKPQRQSRVGVWVEGMYTFLQVIRNSWYFILYLIIRSKDFNFWYVGGVVLLIVIIVGVIGYIKYLNFTFYIDSGRGEFILRHGVFNKKQIAIQLGRIQQVNINQSPIQKLVNVYGVEVETAGSAKSEAAIKAVPHGLAQVLKEELLRKSTAGENTQSATDSSETFQSGPPSFISISTGSLVKVGLTSKYAESFALLLAFIFAIYNNIKDAFRISEQDDSAFDSYLGRFMATQILVAVFAGLVLVAVLFNLVRTLITYYHLKISRQGESLMLSYGLINSVSTVLHPHKVQVVRLVSNYLQRKMGILWMSVQQASTDRTKNSNAHIQIPGCSVEESKRIMAFIFDELPQKGAALLPNYRKMFSSIFVFVLIPLSVYVFAVWHDPVRLGYLYAMIFYMAVVLLFIYLSYRSSRLYVHEGFIIKQHGIWDIHTQIMEPHKIQGITTTQYSWHRRADVGHVTIHTAGGNIVFRFGNFKRIESYVNQWLYQVESSRKEWM